MSYKRTMIKIGEDDFSRPVYRCKETGAYWKDTNLGRNNVIDLYSSNGPYGEPDMPIKKDIKLEFKENKYELAKIVNSSSDGGFNWIVGQLNGRICYDITQIYEPGEEEKAGRELADSMSFQSKLAIKIDLNDICEKLQGYILELLESENEIWFVEKEDISEKDIEEIKEEVSKLKLEDYIIFGENDAEITLEAATLTKFLF